MGPYVVDIIIVFKHSPQVESLWHLILDSLTGNGITTGTAATGLVNIIIIISHSSLVMHGVFVSSF